MTNQAQDASETKVRHILSLSGGKDSTALAIYMRDRVSDMEYVFCDTAKELPETYEYLERLEAFLGKSIVKLKQDENAFDRLLDIRRNFLPSPQMRWCTEELKIKPFERFVGDERVITYIGIRADENRKGYISRKPNITPCYPFIEDGIVKDDVTRLLDESGLGYPPYYEWRSRSGCYFCFYQQRIEWVGLLEQHPDLFALAQSYEKTDPVLGKTYTWVRQESLEELSRPERVAQIKQEFARRMTQQLNQKTELSLFETLSEDTEDGNRPCIICDL